MDKSSIGNRMKRYESVPKIALTRRTPVIIRLDGKAFHTFTRGFDKPFDNAMMYAMQHTMGYLCENIQGCVLGYTQSDEITLVLCDYQTLTTDAWYDYEVQKMCSISAAMATFAFRMSFEYYMKNIMAGDYNQNFYQKKLDNGVFFDSRCFNVPKEEVNNCLLWRQQDVTRNSIQGLAQSLFSHKELQGLSCNMLQDKMFTEKGINWNDLPTYQKRGSCCVKIDGVWTIDTDIPVFSQDTDYVNSRITF